MSRAQELVDAHFDGYVGPLLTAAGVEEKVIALCAFMYKSSGIHFYKHCQEDAVEAARGAFANAAAQNGPSLCDSCAVRVDDYKCVLYSPNEYVSQCIHYRGKS